MSEFVGKTVAKASPEVQGHLLSGLRNLQLNVSSNEACEESKQVLSRLLPYILLKDKGLIRSVQIDVFDSAFLSVYFAPHEGLVEKARAIYKFLAKQAKNEEVEGSAYRLMATILAHGPDEYFRKHALTFLNKILLRNVWSARRKDAALEALLRLLRGRYVPQTDISPFAFAPFRHNFPDSFKEILSTIFETLFTQKNVLPRMSDSLEVCVAILLQVGAHSMTLLQSMLNELAASGHVWHHVLVLRTLRYLLDDTLPSLVISITTPSTITLNTTSSTLSTATLFWSHAASLRETDSKGNTTSSTAIITQLRREMTDLLITTVKRLFKGLSESLLDEIHSRLHQSGADVLVTHPLTVFLFASHHSSHPGNVDISSILSLPQLRDVGHSTASPASEVVDRWLKASSSDVPLQSVLADCTPPRLRYLREKFQLTIDRLRSLYTTPSEDLDNEIEYNLQRIVHTLRFFSH